MPVRHCPSGSEPQILSAEIAFIAAADVIYIADLLGSPLLDFLIFPFVDAAFDVATLCNSDPPDPPTFNTLDFLDPAIIAGKIELLIGSFMWDVWCQ